MAKKKTSLKDKLAEERINRNKEEVSLASKKNLRSSVKNVKAIENQVEEIHKDAKKELDSKSKSAEKQKVKEKSVRLTVDITKDMHKKVKIKVAEMETKIQWYLYNLIEEDLKKK